MWLNFYSTFISGISLILDQTSFTLVQTLLNPPQVLWHYSFLSSASIDFANEEKEACTIEPFPYSHSAFDEN